MQAGLVLPPRCAPFDALADHYDELFTRSLIGRLQRQQVWRAIAPVFCPGERILELNCGTGIDAIWFTKRGIQVEAFDQSPRMIEVAKQNAEQHGIRASVRFDVLDNSDLSRLSDQYDGAFSNFAGLNCSADLGPVAIGLARLVRPKAKLLLCVSARYCAWEALWYGAHLNLRKAFRRTKTGGSAASIGDHELRLQYPTLRTLCRTFSPHFSMAWATGVGLLVPPTYMEAAARRVSSIVRTASKLDEVIGRIPLLREMADHLLVCFVRGNA